MTNREGLKTTILMNVEARNDTGEILFKVGGLDNILKYLDSQGEMMEIPQFASEDEERKFWATHDSTDYVDTATPEILEYSSIEANQ